MGDYDLTILIIDDELRAELYEMWLEGAGTIRTASSREEALSNVDDTVAVVLMRNELQPDVMEAVETKLESVSPAAKIALTTSERSEIAYPDVDCEMTVCEPINEVKIQETVETLLGRALYHDGLRRYYSLTLQLTNSEFFDEPDAESTSDDRLRSRIEATTAKLDGISERLTTDDILAVRDSLRSDVPYPVESEDSPDTAGKYLPAACSDCGLEWGTDHGGQLDEGYRSLGAHTWKCLRCGRIENIRNPNSRKVARRDV